MKVTSGKFGVSYKRLEINEKVEAVVQFFMKHFIKSSQKPKKIMRLLRLLKCGFRMR